MAPEPYREPLSPSRDLKTWLREALIEPFAQFIEQHRWHAVLILALIGVYRISDVVMGIMANPFYVDMGYTKEQVAAVSKIFGVIMTLLGAFIGGAVLVGWLLFLAYAFQSPINTNLFGFFVPQVLQRDFGIDLTAYWWVFALGIIVFVGWLAYESLKYSLRLDIIFVALEVVVLAVLLIYIVVTGGAEGQSPQSFTPSLAPGPSAPWMPTRLL